MRRPATRAVLDGHPVVMIPLTRGKTAIVDECDAHLANFSWQAQLSKHTWYAQRNVKGLTWALHRAVLDAPPGVPVDHINGDGLDNRRANLRLATLTGNNRNARKRKDNTSGFRGITWKPRQQKWQAAIRNGAGTIYLGLFPTREDAARAYDAAAVRVHGEFARLNFPGARPVPSGDHGGGNEGKETGR